MFTATFSKMVAKVFRKGLQNLREAISPISTEIFIVFPFKITGTESNDPFGFSSAFYAAHTFSWSLFSGIAESCYLKGRMFCG